MKNLFLFLACFVLNNCTANNTVDASKTNQETANGEYIIMIEGFDWGPAASKVILSLTDSLSQASGDNFEVNVKKATPCIELKPEEATGQLIVQYAYVSDAKANRRKKGTHITLVLYTAPFESVNAPMKYFFNNPNCNGNQWLDFDLTISNKTTNQIWNKEKDRIMPLIDNFDLSGKFSHKDITLTYADYTPKSNNGKRPLLIWLHGGGEGGTDPTIALAANRAANYAAPEIQAYFRGAYVLVPQTPTFWMNNGKGNYTRGEVNDMYNESLMALIKDYINKHPKIDKNRIYIGGCSNGGYMTLKLLLEHPNYFAAAFPSALAYFGEFLTDAQIESIKEMPIWFIHSKDDPVTVANKTVVPVYKRLIKAGAKKVHFSFFDHVVDITGQFGGANFYYNGHFSWVYSHTNKCQLDYDGTPVKVNGQPVTLMGWMAMQSRK